MILHCKIDREEYVLVNVHLRCYFRNASPTEYNNCLQQLWSRISKFNVFRILIAGDFNCPPSMIDTTSSPLSPTAAKVIKVFQQFRDQTGLSDCWRVLHSEDIRFTHTHRAYSSTCSRIDMFLASNLMLNYLYEANIGVSYLSDHCPIYVTFYLNRNTKGTGVFRFPDHLLQDEVFVKELSQVIDNTVYFNSTMLPAHDKPDPSLLWDTVKSSIRGATIEYLAKKKYEKNRVHTIEKEISQLIMQRDVYLKYDIDVSEILEQVKKQEESLSVAKRTAGARVCEFRANRAMALTDVCSRYFFRKVRGIPGSLRHVFNDIDELVDTDEQILQTCQTFYENLYSLPQHDKWRISNFEFPDSTSYLTDAEKALLSEEITQEDLLVAVKKMKKNTSPGVGGLTADFYVTFWPQVGKLVHASLRSAESNGTFSISQRRGLIKLLPKRSKDPRFVKNLRPITLLNVDYKMFTKVLALRLREILPRLIHPDQNGFVQGRFIGTNIMDVHSLIKVAEQMEDNEDFVFLSLDIRKAFDTINWRFLMSILNNYGFPPRFLEWVRVMQANAYVHVLNNGHMSQPIKLEKGVPQGCCASPYFFILCIEALAHHIRQDTKIPGIAIDSQSKTVSMIADDTLLSFKGSETVLTHVVQVLNHFSHASGLSINFDKSVLVALGKKEKPMWFNTELACRFKQVHIAQGFDYLGIFMSSEACRLKDNFQVSPDLISDAFSKRPSLRTTVSGRILQVKQLVASKFVYFLSLLPSPGPKVLGALDKLYTDYVWDGGCHRLAKTTIQATKANGGLNMINVYHQNLSLKFAWVGRLLADSARMEFWMAHVADCFIIPVHHALRCNVHPLAFHMLLKSSPTTILPCFWSDVFILWFRTWYIPRSCTNVALRERMLNVLVCFNSACLSDNFSEQYLVYDFLASNGVITLRDFCENKNTILQLVHHVQLANHVIFCLSHKIAQISPQWDQVIGNNYTVQKCHVVDRCLAGLATSNFFLELLKSSNPPSLTSPQGKWNSDLEITLSDSEFAHLFKLGPSLPTPKIQDFHVQFLHRAYHLNGKVASYNDSVSDKCALCFREKETYVHLFWDCPVVLPLWVALTEFVTHYFEDEKIVLTQANCLLSNTNARIVNVLTVCVKHFIFVRKCIGLSPCISEMFKYIEKVRNAHRYKAKIFKSLSAYEKLWGILIHDVVFHEIINYWVACEN